MSASTPPDTSATLRSKAVPPRPGAASPGRRGIAAATRARLLHSARELANKASFDRVTVAQVTDHAGISRATYYLYFDNIREIYLELARDTAEMLFERAVSSWVSVNLDASIRAWVRNYVVCFRENAGVLRVSYGHRFDDTDFNSLIQQTRLRLARQLAINLDGAMALGLARPIETEITAESLNSMLESMCVFEFDTQQPRDLDSLCDVIAELWYHAVSVKAH